MDMTRMQTQCENTNAERKLCMVKETTLLQRSPMPHRYF